MQVESKQSIFCLIGLGREGWSSYQYLLKKNPEVSFILTDDSPVDQLSDHWQTALKQPYTSFQSPTNLAAAIQDGKLSKSIAVISPGVPPSHPLLQAIDQAKVQTTSNTALFFEAIKQLPIPPLVIGVTGTKGKSTTTAVIHHVLHQNSKYAYYLLGGNIGLPALDLLSKITELFPFATRAGLVILELSAHQLRLLQTSAHIAVIQQITQEHFDYYPSFAEYVEAKSHITKFQTNKDVVICNQEFEIPLQLAQSSQAQLQTFTTHQTQPEASDDRQSRTPSQPIAWIENQTIICNGQSVLSINQLPLLGKHNLENVMPAVVIAHHLGMSKQEIAQGLLTFKPLPHRLQKVAEINQILYVNDSLSTTPEATIAAIQSFPQRPIVLIAGGHDRHLDYSTLCQHLLQSNIRGLVLFPTTGELIASNLKSPAFPIQHVISMADALKQANLLAQPGDVVLLSPAAASFNLFKDYADRGNQFIQTTSLLEDK